MPPITVKCPECGNQVKMDEDNSYGICGRCETRVPRPEPAVSGCGVSAARAKLESGNLDGAVRHAEDALAENDRNREAWTVKGLAELERAAATDGIRNCVPVFREAVCCGDREEGFLSVCGEIAGWYDRYTRKTIDDCAANGDGCHLRKGLVLRGSEKELVTMIAMGLVSKETEEKYIAGRKAELLKKSEEFFDEGIEELKKFDGSVPRIPGAGTLLIVMSMMDGDGREEQLRKFSVSVPGIMASVFSKACDPALCPGWSTYKNVWNTYVGLLKEIAAVIPDRGELAKALKEGSERSLREAMREIKDLGPPWPSHRAGLCACLGKSSAACTPFPGLEPDNIKIFAEASGRLESAYKSSVRSFFKPKVDPDRRDIDAFKEHIELILNNL